MSNLQRPAAFCRISANIHPFFLFSIGSNRVQPPTKLEALFHHILTLKSAKLGDRAQLKAHNKHQFWLEFRRVYLSGRKKTKRFFHFSSPLGVANKSNPHAPAWSLALHLSAGPEEEDEEEEEDSCITYLAQNIRLQLIHLFRVGVRRGLHPHKLITLGPPNNHVCVRPGKHAEQIPGAYLEGLIPLSRSSRPWWAGFARHK